ncbi:hypothetical protein ASD54_04730 [Rhizobium sp. Root149]|nr:hypothetical protein ASD54_04730 [Rhizobium sp. Root149]
MGAGIAFERFKPDGNLEWRIFLENNNIFVNCLSYTRWEEVWGRAHSYFKDVLALVGTPDNVINGASLQYINSFKWDGNKEDYDVKEILSFDSHVPASVATKGHLWHLHQGWFDQTAEGRILERVHVDGIEDESASPIIRFDAYIQQQLTSPQAAQEIVKSGWLDSTFTSMHDRNKKMLKSFIVEKMAERINLNVA